MGEQFNVAVVVGSVRKDSISRKIAKSLIELQPASLDCSIVEIGDLPLYNEDPMPGRRPAGNAFARSYRPAMPFFL
ncbi:NAD(P)H-dependent FMN reductase [Phyllobacterium myrsinacearum]|uniref:NAD(P)H-dependent FMN reductase n=1 Tax=Phyllobacterium myrsinacearum TaxID=28101 RepID=A0A839EP12_9HYPH|nr:NAD(P)H-dependent oxidoreductase [Phyllobacterium myrsinacearum]MBA8881821.1 NAD(P)H-dependent FMN reductase [Phyllobacterium myrsinacearum]